MAVVRGVLAPARAPNQKQAPSLAEQAYTLLKREIVRCEMEPGAYFTEAQLVKRIAIGKTPLRAALARLAQDGLVVSFPQHGYQVAPITLRDVQEVFAARLVVEPAVARLAAGRVDAGKLKHTAARAAAMRGSLSDPDKVADYLRLNHEMHVAIAAASGNSRLVDMVEQLLDQCARVLQVAFLLAGRSQATTDMGDFIEALASGDGDRAATVGREQIEDARRMVMDILLSTPSVLSAPLALPRLTHPVADLLWT